MVKDVGKDTYVYLLDVVAGINSKYPAIIYKDKVFTWKEFDERSNQLANAFLDLGMKRGDKSIITSYNNNEYMEYVWGAIKIVAAPSSGLNFRYTADELKYVIDKSDAKVLLLHEDLVERIGKIRPDLNKVEEYIVIGDEANVPEWADHYESLIGKYPKTKPKFDWDPMQDDEVGITVFTGGTTGMPKGVQYKNKVLIHAIPTYAFQGLVGLLPKVADAPTSVFKGIVGGVKSIPGMLGSVLSFPGVGPLVDRVLDSSLVPRVLRSPLLPPLIAALLDVVPMSILVRIAAPLTRGTIGLLNPTPMIHSWGIALTLIPLELGGYVAFPTSKSFNARECLEMIDKWKIPLATFIGDAMVRPIVDILDAEPGCYDLRSLILTLIGAIGVDPEIKRRFLRHRQHLFLETIASSEAYFTGAEIYLTPDETLEKGVFRVSPYVRVVNEKGKDVKPGELGEIVQDASTVSKGYYKDEEKTKKAFREIDGKAWFATGDAATVDEKGRVVLIGRGSECINTGGEKVFPEETEELIMKHPAVEDVGCVGIPDKKWGEAVCAAVKLKDGEKLTEEEIIKFCKGKIAGYKVPKRVVFLDEIPRTPVVGKVHYRKVRDLVKKELGSVG